jgi:hypothetical protein
VKILFDSGKIVINREISRTKKAGLIRLRHNVLGNKLILIFKHSEMATIGIDLGSKKAIMGVVRG